MMASIPAACHDQRNVLQALLKARANPSIRDDGVVLRSLLLIDPHVFFCQLVALASLIEFPASSDLEFPWQLIIFFSSSPEHELHPAEFISLRVVATGLGHSSPAHCDMAMQIVEGLSPLTFEVLSTLSTSQL